ncbi:PH domain-containing protein [Promicromonospora sp. MEB111]|uniref:PH domain-containing protein n=1 Tax=Promicromonospora sp. MEB111 TaxID=3040301 RepID=UPI0025509AA9|nr:PH domain-containing protein [Promicromonospora sp. MEB111]
MSAAADFVIRHRALQRYILADEKVIVATRRHWARLWEPILTTTGAFVLGLAILVAVDPDVRDSLAWVWLPFLVLGLRLLYKWLDWRAEWFVMTDRRLILLTGLLVHRVAMMPAEKVTDLGYERTPLGQVLGFGTFIFETAGQDQALDRVTWIPRPDSRYRLIIATLFHPDAADAEAAAQADPDFRPQAAPPVEPAPAAPPALMPRIGRRSNPPTQRIEVPVLRDLAGPVPGASGVASDGVATSGVVSDGVVSDGVAPDRGAAGNPLARGAGQAGAGQAGVGSGSAAHDGAGGTRPGGGEPAGAVRPPANGTAAVAASSGSTRLPGRTSDGKGGDHVPGGPTSATDGSDALPSPFIEGGKDPKIR